MVQLKDSIRFVNDVSSKLNISKKYANNFGNVPFICSHILDNQPRSLGFELHVTLRVYVAVIRMVVIDRVSKKLNSDKVIINYVKYMHKNLQIDDKMGDNNVLSMGVLVDFISSNEDTVSPEVITKTKKLVKHLSSILPSMINAIIETTHSEIRTLIKEVKYNKAFLRVFYMHRIVKPELDAIRIGIMSAYVLSVENFIDEPCPMLLKCDDTDINDYEKMLGSHVFTLLQIRRNLPNMSADYYELSSKELSDRIDPDRVFSHIPGILSGLFNPHAVFILDIRFIQETANNKKIHNMVDNRVKRLYARLMEHHFNCSPIELTFFR